MAYDLGDLAFYEGNYGLAQNYYKDCLAWASQKGLLIPTSWAKVRLGYVAVRRGEQQNARSFFREALQSFQAIGVQNGVLFTLEGFASLAVTQSEYDKAVRILAWADAAHERMDYQRPPVEQATVESDLAVIHA